MAAYLRTATSRYISLVTLTYPAGAAPSPERAYRDLRTFTRRLERYWDEHLPIDAHPSFFWFREFTESGTVHYHAYVTHWIPMSWLSATWADVCDIPDPELRELHERAGTRIERLHRGRSGQLRYARKYAQKQSQKALPDGVTSAGRWWGIVGERGTVSADIFVHDRWQNDIEVMSALSEMRDALTKLEIRGLARRWEPEEYTGTYWYIRRETDQVMVREMIERIRELILARVLVDIDVRARRGVEVLCKAKPDTS